MGCEKKTNVEVGKRKGKRVGVSIVSYKELTPVAHPVWDEQDEPVGIPEGRVLINVTNGLFWPKALGSTGEGWYAAVRNPTEMAFSYLEYGQFRERLSHAAFGVSAGKVWGNPGKYCNPLVNIVDFTDCCGWLGEDVTSLVASELTRLDFRQRYVQLFPKERDVNQFDGFVKVFVEAQQTHGIVDYS